MAFATSLSLRMGRHGKFRQRWEKYLRNRTTCSLKPNTTALPSKGPLCAAHNISQVVELPNKITDLIRNTKSDMTYQDPNAAGAAHESSLESRYRKLLHVVPDAILEVDQEGRITILNEAAERMFGYTRAELLGLNVENLVPAAMRSGHAKHRSSYAEHAKTRPMGTGLELQGQRKDGSLFPVEISLSPNWIDGSLHVIASVRDITEAQSH